MPKRDKEQSDRFIKKAKELATDETGNLFEHAFKKIVPPAMGKKKIPKRTKKNHA